MANKTRVYVAGAYNGPDVISVLNNMRRGIRLAVQALQTEKIIPFAPWFDYHFLLHEDKQENEITIQTMYDYSMSFLIHWAEAILVQPTGANQSKGTQKELDIARTLGIPIFKSLDDLLDWIRRGKPCVS